MAWLAWLLSASVCVGLVSISAPRTGLRVPVLLAVLGLAARLLLVRRSPSKIPVLNYHSVSAQPEWMEIGHVVSMSPDTLERQLAWLQRRGYRTLLISELYDVLSRHTPADARARYVALTFDDGFLDNWVAVFPLLRKYGAKATVFVSTDFVEPGEQARPTRDDVAAGRAAAADLTWEGYLNWGELRTMADSGLVEIQSHAASHTREFTGPELRGFVAPGRENAWIFWNRRPDLRQRWWRELRRDSGLWGHPVFPQAPALAVAAYRPKPAAVEDLLGWTRLQGPDFFRGADWERRLRAAWARMQAAAGGCATTETDADYARRIDEDLRRAKCVLEDRLGKPVRFLCWPENAFTAVGEDLARAAGHVATISNRHASTNTPGRGADRIVRVFIGSRAAGLAHAWLDFVGFVLEIKVFEGGYLWYPPLAVMHLARKLCFALRSRFRCPKDYLSAWA